MKEGSDQADYPEYIASREHYMDPMDHAGLYIWPVYYKSAGTLCQEKFEEATMHWANGEYVDAMGDLGWAAHLVQDICVPHHALTYPWGWHAEYEDWVDNNKDAFAVTSGGVYSFSPFPDRQFYPTYNSGPPSQAYWHYAGDEPTAYDWVDYNAHESIKYFAEVNSVTNDYVTDLANPYIETSHPLPNNLETVRILTTYLTSGIQLHFEKIDMESGYDYVYIYDKYDNLQEAYTGLHGDFWTPWYPVGDTVKIKVKTDASVESWGYKIKEVKYYDIDDNPYETTSVLLPRAQRTTAGFIKFFFDTVLSTVHIRSDGSVYPSTAPIQRNENIYTFTSNVYQPITIEKDNVLINGSGHVLQAIYYNIGNGFHLLGRYNVTIQDTTISNFDVGITLWNSTNIKLIHNILTANNGGVFLYQTSNNNSLSENSITGNQMRAGSYLNSSLNNILTRNFITNNYDGIDLRYSSNDNNIFENNITANARDGIEFDYSSSNNNISANNITANTRNGIELYSSSNFNNICGNVIERNNPGIWIGSSSNNLIYHNNFVNNTQQVIIDYANNVWDAGYPSGGNYWSDYGGTDLYRGPCQDETGRDGIGDTPEILNANNRDRYPLFLPHPPYGISVINPGPDGYPNKWTASTKNRGYGTYDFTFFSNETGVGSCFFVNTTMRNVELLRSWQIGLVFENATLEYISAWLPTDHIFKPAEENDWTFIKKFVLDDLDATHKILKAVSTYAVPDPPNQWSFNGTGTLCQIQFRIVKQVNETQQQISSYFTFDPDWTSIIQYMDYKAKTPGMIGGCYEYKWALNTTISVVNPGPDGYSAKWNASITTRNLGTPNFIFYSNETAVNPTFFINVTITNARCIRGWQIGIIFEDASLEYVSAWLPSDHVFRTPEVEDWSFVKVFIPDEYNSTHKIIKGIASYAVPDPSWSFNGSGTLCQIQFKLIKPVNSTNPSWSSIFVFDMEWTAVARFDLPTPGTETPNVENGYVNYTFRPCSDIDKNGKVDLNDIVTVLDAFGSIPGKPNWNGNCDLDENGKVELSDLVTVLDHFGKTYP
jgi:parallel beta-helix repeat protein